MCKKNKTLLIASAVFLQCLTLAGICFQRELIVRHGDIVFMRTAPVDPRDLFRGDYVRLAYEVSNLPSKYVPGSEVEAMKEPEKKAYLSFTTDQRGVVTPLSLSLQKPCEGRFISGYTQRTWQKDTISVRFGIEKYFMQQKKGLVLERGESVEGVHIPLEMEVAVGKRSGIAVLKGYRYADMGMGIQLPRNRRNNDNISFKIIIKVANASDKPLAIVDPEDHSTFTIALTTNQYGSEGKLKLKHYPKDLASFKESDVKLIKPQSVYSFELDLGTPDYQLVRGDKEISWQDMQWGERAQIVYNSPDVSMLKDFKHAESLWQGQLSSRSFTRANFID
ncbi:MAG: GDYXXLXY domain-containing protein [bacterium]